MQIEHYSVKVKSGLPNLLAIYIIEAKNRIHVALSGQFVSFVFVKLTSEKDAQQVPFNAP